MGSIGKVLHILKNNNLLVQCAGKPPQGKIAFDENGARIGLVKEIFGPVKNPYISIKPTKGIKVEKLVGKTIHSK